MGNLADALISDNSSADTSAPSPAIADNSAPDIGASMPDVPSAAPNLSAPSQPLPQPTQPAPDLPRFRRTFSNTLRGIAVGFGLAGLPGAVAGGINPQGIQREADSRAAIAAANQHFASARASHETLQAALLEKQVNQFDDDHQQQMERIGLDNLKAAQEAGFSIVSVSPLDGDPADNARAAMNNLEAVKKANGGQVPEGLLHIHAGNSNGIFTLQLQNPAAALDTINQTRRAQGLPELDSGTFMGLSPQERQNQAKDAINFTFPTDRQSGQISQDSVTTLENRLALVKAQPAFNGQDQLVANLQRSLDLQSSALQHEATRKGQAAGAEALGAQPGTTGAQIANINATAGPEAAAAGEKAGAVAKAQLPYQLVLENMKNTANPVYAYDPSQKATILTTQDDAKGRGLQAIRKVTENDISKDTQTARQIGDAQMNVSAYRVALNKMQGLSGTDLTRVAALVGDDKFKAHLFGVEVPVDWYNQLRDNQKFSDLPDDAKDAIVGYIGARGAIIAYTKAISGTGRLTESQLQTEMQNLPKPTDPQEVAEKKFARFQRNIDQAASGLPRLPGVDLPADIRTKIEGQAPGNPTQLSLLSGRDKSAVSDLIGAVR